MWVRGCLSIALGLLTGCVGGPCDDMVGCRAGEETDTDEHANSPGGAGPESGGGAGGRSGGGAAGTSGEAGAGGAGQSGDGGVGGGQSDCLEAADACWIGDVCYREGDPNPNNECEKCLAGSPLLWSSRTGESCTDDGLFCNGVETCSPQGTCDSVGDPCGAKQTCYEPELACIDECADHPVNPDSDGDGTPDACAVVSVGGGADYLCAITASGSAVCWGECKGCDGLSMPAPSGRKFLYVTSGADFTCALDDIGEAYCWGSGTRGQVGNGALSDAELPNVVTGSHSFRAIDAGREHVCGVDFNGAVYCWGGNSGGQAGPDEVPVIAEPERIATPEGVEFEQVSAGGHDSCALSTNGKMYCWGWPWGAEVRPFAHSALVFRRIFAGPDGLGCGIDTDGSAYCWGSEISGRFGDGSETATATEPVAVAMPPDVSFEYMAVSARSVCALTSKSAVYCWGDNSLGTVGTGDLAPRLTPVRVDALEEPMGMVGASHYEQCSISSAGRLFCWGSARGPTPVPVDMSPGAPL